MADFTGLSSLRSNHLFTGNTYLPPKNPTTILNSSSHCNPSPDDGSLSSSWSFHLPRSSSANILLEEEQPSWLDDLLNEPEVPVKKVVHRRSSSDPFNNFHTENRANENLCSWVLQNQRRSCHNVQLQDPISMPNGKSRITSLEQESDTKRNVMWRSPPKDDDVSNFSEMQLCQLQELNLMQTSGNEMQTQIEWSLHALKNSDGGSESDQNDSSTKPDSKRVKQNNARRSRVRKLQFIAEMERRVQALHVGVLEVSAELEFLHQQNVVLGMENRALKQQLDSLTQIQFVKSFERDVLEREIGRLQQLHHQQLRLQQQQQQQKQQQQWYHPSHRQAKTLDTDLQFANLDLKAKEAAPNNDGFGDLF